MTIDHLSKVRLKSDSINKIYVVRCKVYPWMKDIDIAPEDDLSDRKLVSIDDVELVDD